MARKQATPRTPRQEFKLTLVSPEPSFLLLRADYLRLGPEAVFDRWTRPELLIRWWPPEADMDLRVGGHYRFCWPEAGWELEGEYLSLLPPKEVAFSWRWKHEPALVCVVKVTVEPGAVGGTTLFVRQGPYSDSPAGVEQRLDHLNGWTFFLPRLLGVPPPSQPARTRRAAAPH
ncbi:MAG: SRPBCC domain-containing protein [Thermoplasmata archaeon]|nr:SRPBCC domain-containing protein [Thermoplasmata archaeon]